MKQTPQPHTCEACGELLPEGSHALRRYCYSCSYVRGKAKATLLQREWRARHPQYWRKRPQDESLLDNPDQH
jgi:predicted  nucleic acid-binding Zn-ribbon protein